jgi:hypothetical protein
METLIFIFVGFIAWLYAAKFINDNYQRSRGLSSLFWLILLLGTVSFLFGSSNTNTPSGGGEEGNNHSNYNNFQLLYGYFYPHIDLFKKISLTKSFN